MRVHNFSFSTGNKKLGAHVGNFSVLGGVTCPDDAPCKKGCYMNALRAMRPIVRNAYADNARLLMIEHKYDEFVDAACFFIWENDFKMFRFDIDGDFFSLEYLNACCTIAKRNPTVSFMAFTKQFAIAEKALALGIVPENFNIVFSAWNEYKPNDVSAVPVAYYDDGEHPELIPEKAFICPGNKSNCKKCGYCWKVKPGQAVILKKH